MELTRSWDVLTSEVETVPVELGQCRLRVVTATTELGVGTL